LGAFFVAYAAPEPELGNGMERNGSTWPLDEQLAICDYRSAASSQCPCTYKVHLSSRGDDSSKNAILNGQSPGWSGLGSTSASDVGWSLSLLYSVASTSTSTSTSTYLVVGVWAYQKAFFLNKN